MRLTKNGSTKKWPHNKRPHKKGPTKGAVCSLWRPTSASSSSSSNYCQNDGRWLKVWVKKRQMNDNWMSGDKWSPAQRVMFLRTESIFLYTHIRDLIYIYLLTYTYMFLLTFYTHICHLIYIYLHVLTYFLYTHTWPHIHYTYTYLQLLLLSSVM